MAKLGFWNKGLVVIALGLGLVNPTFAAKTATNAFTAVTNQGRPMVGAVVAVTDSMGGAISACEQVACTSTITQIPASGILQFYQDPGTYNVTIAGSGITRSFVIVIPAGVADALTDGDFAGTGFMEKLAPSFYRTVKSNLTATADPTANDDSTDDYEVGSMWINLSTDNGFFCTDNTPTAAVWRAISNAGGITSIIGESGAAQTGPGITINTGTSASDFTTASAANIITLKLPSMVSVGVTRGLLTNGVQTIPGAKTFSGGLTIFDNGMLINASGGATGDLTISSDNVAAALFMDAGTDQFGFFTAALSSGFAISMEEGVNEDTLSVENSTTNGTAIQVVATGDGTASNAIIGIAGAASDGVGILGSSSGNNAFAGRFIRNVSAGTVPVVEILRGNSSDGSVLLELEDSTATTAASNIIQYKLNSIITWALKSDGRLFGTEQAVGFPTFSVLGDQSGMGFVGEDVILYSAGIRMLTCEGSTAGCGFTGFLSVFDNSAGAALSLQQAGAGPAIQFETNTFLVSGAGELTFTGVSADGTGKALCVKLDANIGTCTDAVGGSGTCTCA